MDAGHICHCSPLFLCLRGSVFQSVKHVVLQKLLVGHTHLYGLACRAVLTVPGDITKIHLGFDTIDLLN